MLAGIDLGTTNSAIGVWREGDVEVIPNALGKSLTPSVVGLDGSGDVLVGEAARERLQTHPERTAEVFKRYMGSDREITLGHRSFRPEELSSLVLRSLVDDAEAHLGERVDEVIITVPAYFNDTQRKATRIAGELASLKVRSLLNEPTAAALAHGLYETGESTFLVFDLGGGTFDVSVLELFEGVVEVHASTGDSFLGGEDFLEVIIRKFCEETDLAKRDWQSHPPELQHRIRRSAEEAKLTLSDRERAGMVVHWDDETFEWSLDDERFASLSAPLLERIRSPIQRALRDARIQPQALDRVVLAGGATRMPIVRRLVSQLFQRFPDLSHDPDLVVVRGAAIFAGLRSRDAGLSEMVMTDVAPYTLGVETARELHPGRRQNELFSPIIERNTTVPTSRSIELTTLDDQQQSVKISVFQGESRWTKDNIFLGSLHVPVPPRPAGEVGLEVRFTYDANGLLECEVTLSESGEKHQLVLQENEGVLSPEEVRRRLQELAVLKIHPRDQQENMVAMARAERIYEESLGDERVFMGMEIDRFASILDTQDPRQIEAARERLLEAVGRLTEPDLL